MRSAFRFALASGILFVLAACTPVSPGPSDQDQSSSSGDVIASSETGETRNVSYQGTLDTLGASIYQQGTHKLVLSDGSILVLESTDANLTLDTYLGKKVEVRGTVRPTVEAGGMIMRVEEVTVLTSESGSSSSARKICGGIAGFQCDPGYECTDDLSDSCDPADGGADCGGVCVPVASSAATSASSSLASSATPVQSSSASLSSSVSSASPTNSAEMQAQIQAMAKQNYAASLWTQEYCTSHIAFCVPAHKNWYFKSFGATTSNLWHVEFALAPIESLGQGAIVLNLVSGTSASAGGTSGQSKTVGGNVVGYLDWDGGHFELIADAQLKEPVAYMLANVRAYAQ
jgi:hypothetical protein